MSPKKSFLIGRGSGILFFLLQSVVFHLSANAQCTAPAAITVTSVTNSSVNFSWTTVTGVTGYEYMVKDVDVLPAGSGTFTTGNVAAVASLLYTTRYIYVRSVCAGPVYSGWTRLCKATTASLSGTGSYCETNSVSVGISEGLIPNQVYKWYQAGTTTPVKTETPTDGNGGSQSYNIASMAPANAGTYSVTVEKSGCESSTFGNSVVVYAYPDNLQITNATQSTVSFKWQKVGSSGYEYAVTATATPPTSGTATSTTNATVSGLPVRSAQFIHVRASCNFGTNFGNWNSLSFSTAALPVKLEQFTGKKTTTGNVLTWKAACGTAQPGTINFDLQHSLDRNIFTSIHSSVGASNKCDQVFEFIDKQPRSGNNYYRLNIAENNGQTFFSPILKMNDGIANKSVLSVFPNPITDNTVFQLDLEKSSAVVIKISDVNGKMLSKLTKTGHFSQGVHQLLLSTSTLPPGTYFCQLQINGIPTQTIKLVKP